MNDPKPGAAPVPVLPVVAVVPVVPVVPQEDYGRLPHHVRRLTLQGAIVGAVLFAGLLFLFLAPVGGGERYLLVGDRWSGDSSGAPVLAMGSLFFSVALSALLLFYCLRARSTFWRMVPRYVQGVRVAAPAGRSGRSGRGVQGARDPYTFLKSDLNKIRWSGIPLLFILLLAFGGSTDIRNPLLCLLLTLGIAAGCLGCCAQLIEVRRAQWEVARIEGAAFAAAGVRGFAVLPSGPAAGPSSAGPLRAVAPEAAADPFPAPSAVPLASVAGRADRDRAEAFTDWEKVLHAMAIFALGIYALMVPGFLSVLMNVARELAYRSSSMGGFELQTWAALAAVVLCGLLALGWLVWGVACLGTGPRFRWLVLILAWTGLGLSALGWVITLLQDQRWDGSESVGPAILSRILSGGRGGGKDEASQIVLTFALFPALMLVLVTRPAVKAIFSYRPRRRREK